MVITEMIQRIIIRLDRFEARLPSQRLLVHYRGPRGVETLPVQDRPDQANVPEGPSEILQLHKSRARSQGPVLFCGMGQDSIGQYGGPGRYREVGRDSSGRSPDRLHEHSPEPVEE